MSRPSSATCDAGIYRTLQVRSAGRLKGRSWAAAVEEPSYEYSSTKYLQLCGLGGMLSCGLTHTAIVPLDLVKYRMQVDPGKYKGILSGFGVTVRNDGLRGLARGWAPTFLGYSVQGLFKFGLYEVFCIDALRAAPGPGEGPRVAKQPVPGRLRPRPLGCTVRRAGGPSTKGWRRAGCGRSPTP